MPGRSNMVTVADIIRAVDEPLDATQCGGRENCLDDQRCMTHDLWSTLNARMYDYLSSVTLAELVVASGQGGEGGRPGAPRRPSARSASAPAQRRAQGGCAAA